MKNPNLKWCGLDKIPNLNQSDLDKYPSQKLAF
jgi:hypothetical protein